MNRTLIALALLVIIAVPATALEDVAGWQMTKWGMSEPEVKAAMPDGLRDVSPPTKYVGAYAPLASEFRIDRFHFAVVLQFADDSRRLRQVLITADDASLDRWALARDLLIEKYGPPRQQRGDKIVWLFPSTVIELARSTDPILRLTTIRYYPAAAVKDDKGKF
jgi:hypothetical protein